MSRLSTSNEDHNRYGTTQRSEPPEGHHAQQDRIVVVMTEATFQQHRYNAMVSPKTGDPVFVGPKCFFFISDFSVVFPFEDLVITLLNPPKSDLVSEDAQDEHAEERDKPYGRDKTLGEARETAFRNPPFDRTISCGGLETQTAEVRAPLSRSSSLTRGIHRRCTCK